MKRQLPSAAERGLSGELITGSLPADQPGENARTPRAGELAQLEASVEGWINAALAANELELRASRSELREAASILPPLLAIAREREHKQEIVGKIVVIIADVLEELARREEEQRRLDQNRGKADRLEQAPAMVHGETARSAEWSYGRAVAMLNLHILSRPCRHMPGARIMRWSVKLDLFRHRQSVHPLSNGPE
jgi:hypothetical protein